MRTQFNLNRTDQFGRCRLLPDRRLLRRWELTFNPVTWTLSKPARHHDDHAKQRAYADSNHDVSPTCWIALTTIKRFTTRERSTNLRNFCRGQTQQEPEHPSDQLSSRLGYVQAIYDAPWSATQTRRSSASPERSSAYFDLTGSTCSAMNASTCSGARPMYFRASNVLARSIP